MFGFRQFFGKEDKGKSSRQNQMQVGVQLLGSLLVCYPEIASVTYDPKRDNLELAFMVRQPLPPGKGADEFADFLQESLEAYHELEAGYNAWSSVEAEEQGDTLLFHVARNLMDLSRGELEVMAELMLDRFGDNLMVDSHTEENLEPDFAAMHSELLDRRYGAMERQELQRRRAQELVKSVRRARDRQQRKLAAQGEELRRTEKLEDIRRQAELLQANLYRVRRGDRVLECENYYEEDAPLVTIPLDATKTPQENLNARFKEYRKLKGAKEHLTQLIAEGEKQLEYLNSVLDELSRAGSSRELDEIRSELESTGWLRAQRRVNPKKRTAARTMAPLRFESPDGMEILVGRNNLQNDELTTREARRTDYWFHVQQLHGSHVILRCEGLEPSAEAIRAAAELAAWYSQARDSGRTAVDYTMVLNVKKPSGSLPGKVIYRNYRTVIVDASAAGEGAQP